MSNLDLRYETVTVSGNQALETLQSLRTEGARAGFFPVLLGDEDDAENIPGVLGTSPLPDLGESIHAALTLNVADWMRHRVEEEPEVYGSEDLSDDGEFNPAAGGQPGLTAHMELGKKAKPKDRVLIAKIPTAESWQVPIYLNFGGWNECPAPVELAALAKSWNQRFGADLVACTGDTLEFAVSRPPMEEADCRALAKEHFVACSDVVYQGVETLSALASSLAGSRTWFFWWD